MRKSGFQSECGSLLNCRIFWNLFTFPAIAAVLIGVSPSLFEVFSWTCKNNCGLLGYLIFRGTYPCQWVSVCVFGSCYSYSDRSHLPSLHACWNCSGHKAVSDFESQWYQLQGVSSFESQQNQLLSSEELHLWHCKKSRDDVDVSGPGRPVQSCVSCQSQKKQADTLALSTEFENHEEMAEFKAKKVYCNNYKTNQKENQCCLIFFWSCASAQMMLARFHENGKIPGLKSISQQF